jgi:hypothetical protein
MYAVSCLNRFFLFPICQRNFSCQNVSKTNIKKNISLNMFFFIQDFNLFKLIPQLFKIIKFINLIQHSAIMKSYKNLLIQTTVFSLIIVV